MNRVLEFIKSFFLSSPKRLISSIFVLTLTLAIPITMQLVSQQQDVRQRASGGICEALNCEASGQVCSYAANNWRCVAPTQPTPVCEPGQGVRCGNNPQCYPTCCTCSGDSAECSACVQQPNPTSPPQFDCSVCQLGCSTLWDGSQSCNNGSISGNVFIDSNGDGIFQQSCSGNNNPGQLPYGAPTPISAPCTVETGYSGAIVQTPGGWRTSNTTSSGGRYDTGYDNPGSYIVTLVLPQGYTNTTPLSQTKTISSNSLHLTNVNFGIVLTPTSTPIPTKTPTPNPLPTNTPIPTSSPTPTASLPQPPDPDPTESVLACDPVADGIPNISDYSRFISELKGELTTLTSDCNNNGEIDVYDYTIWLGVLRGNNIF